MENQYWYGVKKLLYSNLLYRVLKLFPVKLAPSCAEKRRIFVDTSIMVKRDHHTGIQRVVKKLYRAFVENFGAENDVVPVYATKFRRGYFIARASEAGMETVFSKTDEQISVSAGDSFLGLDFAPGIVLSQLNALRAMKHKNVELFFILHDLIPLIYPQYFPFAFGALQKRWQCEVIKLGRIICVSRTVSEELRDWFDVKNISFDPDSISWFHNGCDMKYTVENVPLPLSLPKNQPLFLLVGTIEPRKGHAQTLGAFELLWKRGQAATLVFVGKKGWKVGELCSRIMSNQEYGKNLFWFDDCPDEKLASLYQKADAVLAPSEAEGFGLPLVEAASYGTPLILRDIPVFKEIAGEHAFYFRGLEPADMARAVEEWLELRTQGYEPKSTDIKVPSWASGAARIMDIMTSKSLCGAEIE